MRIAVTCAALAAALLIGCDRKPEPMAVAFQVDRFDDAEWSQPVNLGPVINSAATDANATLSTNEHTLYFVSNREGGFGDVDIWYAERRCIGCPWQAPVNIGAPINTAAGDGSPAVSEDGSLRMATRNAAADH